MLADPWETAAQAATVLAHRTRCAHHDVLVVLGTGLASVAGELGATGAPIDLSELPGFVRFTGLHHRSAGYATSIGGRRALLIAGRPHLYEGYTPHQVVHSVRTAEAAGCRTVVLTCAAGAVRPDLAAGSVALIADHINLTAMSPLTGLDAAGSDRSPFVDLVDAWSPKLRNHARRVEPALPEATYAQLPGPHLESPAEIRMLRILGADLVGMSTVLEAIAARHLGMQVLGLAVVTNAAAGGGLSLEKISDAALRAVPVVARVVRGVVDQLEA